MNFFNSATVGRKEGREITRSQWNERDIWSGVSSPPSLILDHYPTKKPQINVFPFFKMRFRAPTISAIPWGLCHITPRWSPTKLYRYVNNMNRKYSMYLNVAFPLPLRNPGKFWVSLMGVDISMTHPLNREIMFFRWNALTCFSLVIQRYANIEQSSDYV